MAVNSNHNKIPIKIRHLSTNSPGLDENTASFRVPSTSTSPRIRDSAGDLFNMTRLSDETDNIHTRMKEFEDRCKKWREEFFSQAHTTGSSTLDFDQRVPPLSPRFSSTSSSSTQQKESNSMAGSLATKPFSTLNKTYYEDLPDGGKKYVIEFDIGDFKANEISVSIQGKSLVVKGDREIKAGSATETKNFNREISLPDHLDLNALVSHLVDKNAASNGLSSASVLYVEAPVIQDKFYTRRSNIRLTPSPPPPPPPATVTTNRTSRLVPTSTSPTRGSSMTSSSQQQFNASKSTKSGYSTSTHTQQQQQQQQQSSSSRLNGSTATEATKSFSNLANSKQSLNESSPQTKSFSALSSNLATSNTPTISASVPDLMYGPTYNKDDGYTTYKFDFKGYDQSEIHLSITENKALEVKASKEIQDNIGKTYKEFKREIQLSESVDINLIKNVLVDGILTIKIPPNEKLLTSPSTNASATLAASTNQTFREIKSQEGRLLKLQTDLTGYDPENLKIILTANNVLKVSAEQIQKNGTQVNTIKFNQEYSIPPNIQPENMKAIMSRDGVLTIDFQAINETSHQPQQQQQQQQQATPRSTLKA